MKRLLRVSIILSLVILLFSTVVFANIIKSDNAGDWALKEGAGKTNFSFIVFGDNRPTSPSRPAPDVLDVMLKEFGYLHPDFVINTGDFIIGYTDNEEQAREEYLGFINDVYKYAPNVNMLFAPGNHETTPDISAKVYRELFGEKFYYDFEYGNSHFIMFQTNFPEGMLEEGQKYGFYNINDKAHELPMIEWAKEALEIDADHTFVSQHVPLFSALTPNFGEHPKSFDNKENRDEELNLLINKGVDAVFSGHEHLVYIQKVDNTMFFTLGGGGAPLYGPTTGGYGINKGVDPDYAEVMSDPSFDYGGHAKGYHYDVDLPASALSIFSYLFVTVNGDKVTYELMIPHNMEVVCEKGNDGISTESILIVANRTPYERIFKGITFLMPYSAMEKEGYEVSGTYVDWGRNEKPAEIQPEILEVKKLNDYQAEVRVKVVVPGSDSVDVNLKSK